MMQAFIDDSGKGSDPVMVLAGYIAPAENWERFSAEWHDALTRMDPPIAYFKMSEAMAYKEQFEGWSTWRRDLRIARLYRLIEEHVTAAVWTIIPTDAFHRTFAPVAKSHLVWRNPYYFLLFNLISEINKDRGRFGITDGIYWTFDSQMQEMTRIAEAWDFWRNDPEAPSEILEIMGDPPAFRDSTKVLPLQAADCMAWWVRRRNEPDALPPVLEPRIKKPLPVLGVEWNENSLRRAFNRMFRPELVR